MTASGLRVTRCRVLAVRRAHPYRFSEGDEAVAELRPDLLRLLSLRDAGGWVLGEGLSPEWVVGIATASAAVYALVQPEVPSSGNRWVGAVNELTWRRAALPDETLYAHCRLRHLGRTSARFSYRVFSREREDLLMEGERIFVNTARSRPSPFVTEFFGDRVPAPPVASSTSSMTATPTPAGEKTSLVAPARIRSLDGSTTIHPLRLDQLGSFSAPREVVLTLPGNGARKGRVFHCGREVPTSEPAEPASGAVAFTAQAPVGYELHVTCEPTPEPREPIGPAPWMSTTHLWEETAEEEVDLFRLNRPRIERQLAGGAGVDVGASWEWLFPVDLFRLLVNPVAGNTEPLGRRLHPYARMAEGMSLHAARVHSGDGWLPRLARAHWILPIRGNLDFRLVTTVTRAAADELAFASTVFEGDCHLADVNVTLVRS